MDPNLRCIIGTKRYGKETNRNHEKEIPNEEENNEIRTIYDES